MNDGIQVVKMRQHVRKLDLPPEQIVNHIIETRHTEFNFHHEYEFDRTGPSWTIYKCLECDRVIRVEEKRE